jgi:hypothetical protein
MVVGRYGRCQARPGQAYLGVRYSRDRLERKSGENGRLVVVSGSGSESESGEQVNNAASKREA